MGLIGCNFGEVEKNKKQSKGKGKEILQIDLKKKEGKQSSQDKDETLARYVSNHKSGRLWKRKTKKQRQLKNMT